MLENLIEDAGKFLLNDLGLSLEKTSLHAYSYGEWQTFLEQYQFNKNAQGVYIPRTLSANVLQDTPFLISNIFHEYFGHGLFCEKSSLGKELVEITQRKQNPESFMYDKKTQQYGICGQNIWNYEGFAVWTEALLCDATNNEKEWRMKRAIMPTEYLELYEHFQDAERLLSRKGLIEQMGF